MKKDQLIEIVLKLLQTDTDLNFLVQLGENDLETLAACIRERIDSKRD